MMEDMPLAPVQVERLFTHCQRLIGANFPASCVKIS